MQTNVNNEVRTPLREVRLRVAVCFAMIMLSSDSLNPVKVVCGILNIDNRWALLGSILTFIVIISANAKELTYFSVKVFLHSICSIFFSSMEVLGKQNIPDHGPIIFTGNHMNQFVDAAVVLIANPHRVGFLIAEKSFNTRIIGDFAKAVGCIPVARPQDKAKAGVGLICFDGPRLVGKDTKFTELEKGDRIRPGKSADSYRLKEVFSDTEAMIAVEYGEASPLTEKYCQGLNNFGSYDVLKFVDQGKMFEKVQEALSKGQCLGIFPEGGSHDNTDLLPLKAGVAAIALGVMDKYNISVPIVPVGLNYFRGHRFRGRVVVEFGAPVHISKEVLQLYATSKRSAYQDLLHQIEDGMRSVIVTATDYSELKTIHTVRRLFQQSTGMPTIWKQDISRRLSTAYKLLKEKYGELPDDLRELQLNVEKYQETLDQWGLKDYQISSGSILQQSFSKLLYIFLHGALILLLASIPSLILNAPVGAAANYWSRKEAQKDLKASRVKVAARDVLLSKKIVFSMVAVPTLWIFYAMLLFLFSPLENRTIVVLFLCCPVFSYMGIRAVQAGVVDIKDLRPAFLRLLPETQHLPELRLSLKKQVKAMVKKYGPEFGPLYYEKSQEWEKMMKKKNNNNNSDSSYLQLVSSQTNLSTLTMTNEKIESSSGTVDILVPDDNNDDNNNYPGAIKKSL